jgi:hypothetical protein
MANVRQAVSQVRSDLLALTLRLFAFSSLRTITALLVHHNLERIIVVCSIRGHVVGRDGEKERGLKNRHEREKKRRECARES